MRPVYFNFDRGKQHRSTYRITLNNYAQMMLYRPLFQSANAQSNVRKLKHTLTSFCQYLLIDTCTVHIVYQNWDSFNLDEFHTLTEKWIDYKLISVSRWKLINKIFAIQINSCIGLCMCIRYNIFDIYMECR